GRLGGVEGRASIGQASPPCRVIPYIGKSGRVLTGARALGLDGPTPVFFRGEATNTGPAQSEANATMSKVRIYLDYNATAPPLPEVVAMVSRAMAETTGNASSVHSFGQQAKA